MSILKHDTPTIADHLQDMWEHCMALEGDLRTWVMVSGTDYEQAKKYLLAGSFVEAARQYLAEAGKTLEIPLEVRE